MAADPVGAAALADLAKYMAHARLADTYVKDNVSHVVPKAFVRSLAGQLANVAEAQRAVRIVDAWCQLDESEQRQWIQDFVDPAAYAQFAAGALPSTVVSLCQHLKLQEAALRSEQRAVLNAMSEIAPCYEYILNSTAGRLSEETRKAIDQAATLVQSPASLHELLQQFSPDDPPAGAFYFALCVLMVGACGSRCFSMLSGDQCAHASHAGCVSMSGLVLVMLQISLTWLSVVPSDTRLVVSVSWARTRHR